MKAAEYLIIHHYIPNEIGKLTHQFLTLSRYISHSKKHCKQDEIIVRGPKENLKQQTINTNVIIPSLI